MDDETTGAENAPTTPSPARLVTQRQVDVLSALAAGETASETAARLGISVKTVEAHRRRLYYAIGAKNGHHAIALGVRRGLITIELDAVPAEVAP